MGTRANTARESNVVTQKISNKEIETATGRKIDVSNNTQTLLAWLDLKERLFLNNGRNDWATRHRSGMKIRTLCFTYLIKRSQKVSKEQSSGKKQPEFPKIVPSNREMPRKNKQ